MANLWMLASHQLHLLNLLMNMQRIPQMKRYFYFSLEVHRKTR